MTGFALNVSRSLAGKRWLWRSVDPRLAQTISQRNGLSELAGRLLAPRAGSLEGVTDYLEPKLRHLLPDPSTFLGMDEAAARTAEAVVRGDKIALFGDYDVDGATSTAQLVRLLRSVGCEPLVHIPNRLTEGYGPNIPALEALAAAGVRLVIFLDCGTTAFAPLEAAERLGLDVVVLDHHTAEAALPPALALINPNRLDQEPGFGQLAACGVTFLFCVALNRALKAAGRAPQLDLMRLLDLVALGTVCDVVPLTGLNRAFVQQGLKVMAGRQNSGLAALADVAGVKDKLTAYHLGFLLGPRINAGGRLGDSSLGVRLLASDDPAACWPIAQQLNELNAERKAVEDAVLEDAIAAADAQEAPLVLVDGAGWHAGVIGIVASRLVERTGRPAFVIGWEEDGTTGKASGRSVAGVDLGNAVIAARQADLLLAGGGHAMAAGFTVAREKLADLHAFLNERLAEAIAQAQKEAALTLEGAISVEGANAALADMVEQLGPYGPGNAEPRFVVQAAPIAFADTVGESHVRARLGGSGRGKLKAIAFRARDTALGQALLSAQGRPLHLAGRLRRDRWTGGDAVELHVEDAAWPE
ncbi:MAG: single-stranded-DNA-specific exonuclease RecJ [Alphaproteobacteria bacterium]|nr:single-stranded-DNA-specific exonuclease RecJ [Alphaproteobacteria bacterium]MCB9930528.1 single-stranded-DNA-specific exonuclease RecJ [Alphaproteobacteria bacterium]